MRKTLNTFFPKAIKVGIKNFLGKGPYPNWKNILSARDLNYLEKIKTNQNVLFATSTGGHRAGNILESTLAIALRLRNVKSEVLLCDKVLPGCVQSQHQNTNNIENFMKHGPVKVGHCIECFNYGEKMWKELRIRIRYYSQFYNKDDIHEFDSISKTIDIKKIKDYKYESYRVGEHALSGALRFFCLGTLDGEPNSDIILKQYLKAALISMRVTENIINQNNYAAVIFYHGIYIPHGIIGEVARKLGVRVVNWNTAYRRKRFIFTHKDTYHQEMQVEDVKNWSNLRLDDRMHLELMNYLASREIGNRDWQQFNKNSNPSIEDAKNELGINFSKPTICLLPNVVWDAQLHYKSNAFGNMIEWVMHSIKFFINRQDLQLIIRIHPAEIKRFSRSRQPLKKEIFKNFDQLPKNIVLVEPESKISTYALASKSNAILIYGTKTGVELTAKGKHVIVAGEAWIRNKGFAHDVSDPISYNKILQKLPFSSSMDENKIFEAKKFAYHFFFRRSIYLPFFDIAKDNMSFNLDINSVRDLDVGKSIGLDVICEGILNGKEFIYPSELNLEVDE